MVPGGSRGATSSRPARQARPFCIQLRRPTSRAHCTWATPFSRADGRAHRHHRMRGYNTLWQLGTDHAGIATQIVVENQLAVKGPRAAIWSRRIHEACGPGRRNRARRSPGRCAASERPATGRASASRWTKVCPPRCADVRPLHEDGLIYRGKRLVHWDRSSALPCRISRSELGARQDLGDTFADGTGSLTVATTRPETMLGDVAVAVNPDDERWNACIARARAAAHRPQDSDHCRRLCRQGVRHGCVKVTPAHDFNDWQSASGTTSRRSRSSISTRR